MHVVIIYSFAGSSMAVVPAWDCAVDTALGNLANRLHVEVISRKKAQQAQQRRGQTD